MHMSHLFNECKGFPITTNFSRAEPVTPSSVQKQKFITKMYEMFNIQILISHKR